MERFSWRGKDLDWLDRALRGLRELGCSLLDLLFPRRCAGCLAVWLSPRQGFWCESCLDQLPWIKSPLCPWCGRPFLKSACTSDHLCGECLTRQPPFTSARSAVQHTGVVRDGINQLKFGAVLHWVPPLAELLVTTARSSPGAVVDFVVPVPLHTRRLRQRGFNQSALIARFLGRSLKVPVRFDVLARSQWTEPQTRLTRRERLRNVQDAFAAAKPADVAGCSILLVDDVFTTGSTLGECSKTLRKAGAKRVHALAVTRAMPEARGEWESP